MLGVGVLGSAQAWGLRLLAAARCVAFLLLLVFLSLVFALFRWGFVSFGVLVLVELSFSFNLVLFGRVSVSSPPLFLGLVFWFVFLCGGGFVVFVVAVFLLVGFLPPPAPLA